MKSNAEVSINNIYRLDGRVPLGKAIPFGLQHVLAMFVANLTPIVIVTAAAGLETSQTAALIQNAMFIAGVATLIQLYPVWRIGAKLPIVMGVSFTFVTILSSVGAKYGYPSMLGAILIGGLVEGTLGLFAKYWRKLISPHRIGLCRDLHRFFTPDSGRALFRRRLFRFLRFCDQLINRYRYAPQLYSV